MKCNRFLRGYVQEDIVIPKSILQRLNSGLPIVYPTSTLPALGCLPNADALDQLFKTKHRDEMKVVSLGVSSLLQASEIVHVPDIAEQILSDFEPGSLTLILPAKNTLDARLGGDSVAVRVLCNTHARALVEMTGPLTATSANLSGCEVLKDCEEAARALNLPNDAAVKGKCVGGAPSTLIAWNVSGHASNVPNWTVLREGKVSEEDIQAWSAKKT